MRSEDSDTHLFKVDSPTEPDVVHSIEFRCYTEPTQKQREYVDILMECEHICPICNTSIGVKGMRYTVSGDGLFPSRICHANCISAYNRDGKGIQYNSIVYFLYIGYTKAVAYRDKYWHWFL